MTQPEALRLADELEMWTLGEPAAAELRRLHEEVERLSMDGIHSCHSECQRPVCRLTRERDALLAEQAEDQGVIAVWRGRTQRAEAQRDALLEPLRRMASIIDRMGDMPDGFIHPTPWQTLKCEEALTQARAAIKAVEEGK